MVSEQANPENRAGVSIYASYSQRICRLATCKKPFVPVRKDQTFCKPPHRTEYHNEIVAAGKKVIAKKEAQERMKGVRAVTQDMTPAERLTALVDTAKAVFNRHTAGSYAAYPLSPLISLHKGIK